MKVAPIEPEENNIFHSLATDQEKVRLNAKEEAPEKPFSINPSSLPQASQRILAACEEELVSDDIILTITYIIQCILSLFHHNLYFENEYSSTDQIESLRVFGVGVAGFTILWIFKRYKVIENRILAKYEIFPGGSFLSTSEFPSFVIELVLAVLVMPPYIDSTFNVRMLGFQVEYSISAIFAFFSMLRVFYAIRLFGHFSEYTQDKARRICQRHLAEANAGFAVKCYIKGAGFIGIAISFFLMSLFFALSMQLCEEMDYVIGGVPVESPLRDFWDNYWVVLYTTTTVGYGNIFPKTHLGRGVCVISCIVGTMYLGMLIVAIHGSMSLDSNQNIAYAWISRESYKKDRAKFAKIAIRKAFTLYALSKKWKCKTISPIRPNGRVVYKNMVIKGDLASLNKNQFQVKLRIYRELRSALDRFHDISKYSREIGKSELNIIDEFEDIVRIDFPKIIKNIKKSVNRFDLDVSESFLKAFDPFEKNCVQVKEFSKHLRQKGSQIFRKQSIYKKSTEVPTKEDQSFY